MKKIFILTVIMIFLTSCSYITRSGTGQKITPPSNVESPIYGQWVISSSIAPINKESKDNVYSELVNKELKITKDYFIIDGYYWNEVSYKSKLLKVNDYFDSIGTTIPKSKLKENKELEVFSIIYKAKLLCELTLVSENSAILNMSGNIYYVSKKSSSTSVDLNYLKPAFSSTFSKKTQTTSNTGVLIGLKTPIKDTEGNNSFSYRTLWISKSNNNFNSIFEINTVIFPRKSGFWTLSEDVITKNNFKENIFIPKDLSQSKTPVNNIEGLDNLVTEQSIHSYSNGSVKKELTYICNDFISVEITGNGTKGGKKEHINKLLMYPVSGLPFENSMSIEDIFKGTSIDFIRNEFLSALDSIDSSDVYIINPENQNIAITRRDAHWLFTGKINYLNNNKFNTTNYNLSVIPPSNIVFYDNLFAPFNEIKKAVPYATDAFSSPNNTMALIISKKNIYIYDIIENPLSSMAIDKTPIAKIKLSNNESVIMSEWATGEYVNSWNNTIKSYKTAKVLKE